MRKIMNYRIMNIDYEKKYNAALEQAKKELKTCGSIDCDAARQIFRFFPELRESKDKRIIEALITHLTVVEKNTLSINCVPMCEILAYLERQKEQIKWPHIEPISEEENLCLMPQEQKPAEWSEEDEYTLGDAITAVDMMLTESFQDSHPNLFKALLIAKDFLKSLPERFNLPPKQEWSEEDEKIINGICGNLEYLLHNTICTEQIKVNLENRIKWLIRLKDLHLSWKPSKEQMEALKYALGEGGTFDKNALKSLFDDLKKYSYEQIH